MPSRHRGPSQPEGNGVERTFNVDVVGQTGSHSRAEAGVAAEGERPFENVSSSSSLRCQKLRSLLAQDLYSSISNLTPERGKKSNKKKHQTSSQKRASLPNQHARGILLLCVCICVSPVPWVINFVRIIFRTKAFSLRAVPTRAQNVKTNPHFQSHKRARPSSSGVLSKAHVFAGRWGVTGETPSIYNALGGRRWPCGLLPCAAYRTCAISCWCDISQK